MRLPSLFVLTDCHLVQDLRGAVIVRDYDHPQREKYARDILKQAKGPVLIAGDITLARRVKAEGLHVPQWQLSRLPQRIFCPPGWLITAACHSLKAIKQAQQNPMIQAVLVSPPSTPATIRSDPIWVDCAPKPTTSNCTRGNKKGANPFAPSVGCGRNRFTFRRITCPNWGLWCFCHTGGEKQGRFALDSLETVAITWPGLLVMPMLCNGITYAGICFRSIISI